MDYEVKNIKKVVREYSDSYTYIDVVREGLAFQKFDALTESLPLSNADWSQYLHLSERTLQRYNKESKSFDMQQTERIMQILILFNLGFDVFGKPEKFFNWLTKENIAVGGKAPKDLLDSSFGIDLLKDELNRIQYGVLA
ncbi:MAG: antitoxin Xre/MbcA/ParS toxin-binding domain-containing protein [Candidatus Kapaibacterium sp.]